MAKETNKNQKLESSKTISFTIDKKFIALIALAIGALLIFIGIFGDNLTFISKRDYSVSTSSAINLDYLFRGSWENINRLIDSKIISVGQGYFCKIEIILCIASFALALIGVTVTILKHVYYFCSKKEFNLTRCFALLSVFSLQYLALARLIYAGGSKIVQPSYPTQTSTNGLGWGGILITIGFFFGLLATIINDSREKNKIVNKAYITGKISSAIIFFICIFGITTMVFLKNSYSSQYGSEYTITQSNSIFSYFYGICSDSFFKGNLCAVTFTLALIALLSSIGGFVLFVLFSYQMFNADDENSSKKMTKFLVIFLILFVVSNILIVVAPNVYYNANKGESTQTVSYTPGYSAYVGLILTILLIVSIALKKKWRLETETK